MENYKGVIIYGILGILMGYLVAAVSFHLSMYIVLLFIGFTGSAALVIIMYVVLVLGFSFVSLFFSNKLILMMSDDKVLKNAFRVAILVMYVVLFIASRVWEFDLSVFE